MKSLDLKSFYAQSLGISAPWRVTDVVFDGDHKVVTVFVECASGVAWVDPETGERAEIKDWQDRTWRHLDTCQFQTIVTARVPRLVLKSGKTMIVTVPWAEPGGRLTKAFESHVIDLLLHCRTVRAVSALTGLGEDRIDGVMERAVARGMARREEVRPRHFGIDDKCIGRRYRFGSLMIDLDAGRVIDVVEGRTTEDAVLLLERLSEAARRNVEAVAMDMSTAYIGAAQTVLPDAAIVFDRFHVVQHLTKAVDLVRRREHASLSKAGIDTLKGTKYEWLRTHDDLRRKSEGTFRALLDEDLRTGKAWALKENFRRIWEYRQTGSAMRYAHKWADAVEATGIAAMKKAAETVKRHLWGIVSFVRHPITNAATEGINSMIQSLRHAARGLPNFASFRNRVLFYLGQLDLKQA